MTITHHPYATAASSLLPGRMKVRWNHHKNTRRTRSFAFFFVFMFLTPFSLLCLILNKPSVSSNSSSSFGPDVVSLEWSHEDNNNDANGSDYESGSEVGGLSSPSPGSLQRLPQCIIIGARKCGTRALLEFLSIHSRIVTARDEVHFFDEDSKYNLGIEWYRQQMPYSTPDQLTIEKTPAYFVTDSAPERIKAMDPSVKLIVIVRDPVVRLISDYAQLNANKVAKGERPLRAFERMVLTPEGDVDINYKPVKTSIYAFYYQRWTEIFPSSQILVVDGDRLIDDPFPEVRKVEDFLDIGHEVTVEHFSFNATKGFYCIRVPGTDMEKCLNETKGRRHPHISSSLIQQLRKFYASYNRQFYLMIGQHFNWPE